MIAINLQCILCQRKTNISTEAQNVFQCPTCSIYWGLEIPSRKLCWIQYSQIGQVYDHYLMIDYEKNVTVLLVYKGEAIRGKTVLSLPHTFPLMPVSEASKLIDRLKNLKAFL